MSQAIQPLRRNESLPRSTQADTVRTLPSRPGGPVTEAEFMDRDHPPRRHTKVDCGELFWSWAAPYRS